MHRKNYYWFYLLYVVVIFIFFELASFLTLSYLQSKGVVYNPAIETSFRNYEKVKDTLLGWPNPNNFGKDSTNDITGSRTIPEFPDPTKNKTFVSMYGDSFTFGAEVDNEHSIANYLSNKLNKRVSNFGVGGYGTDQAFLRYQNNSNDSAQIVILNHFVMDIARNINQFRDIIAPAGGVGFKPVFVMKEKKLKLIPILNFSENNFYDAIENPENYFKYDYYLNEMGGGYIKFTFPYSLKVLQSFNHFRVRSKIFGEQYYYQFYELDHESNALKITAKILFKFIELADDRKQIPIILITPNRSSFEYFFENKKWPYQSLIEAMNNSKTNLINLGEELIEQNSNFNFCDVYIDCVGHFNEGGNESVAKILFSYISIIHPEILN